MEAKLTKYQAVLKTESPAAGTRISKEEVRKFRDLFEQEKRNLLYTQQLINEHFHFTPDDLMDMSDFSSTELEASMRVRLRNREALYLKKIEAALRRIDEGGFGICALCVEPIDIKRLYARPTATHCIYCKEEQEIKESQHIDGRASKSLGKKLRLTI